MFAGLRSKNTVANGRLVAAVAVHVYRQTPPIQQKAAPIISPAQDPEALILPPVVCASLELNTPAFKHYRVGQ